MAVTDILSALLIEVYFPMTTNVLCEIMYICNIPVNTYVSVFFFFFFRGLKTIDL